MRLLPNRSQPLPTRILHSVAVGAGTARLALKQRKLKPELPSRRRRGRVARLVGR